MNVNAARMKFERIVKMEVKAKKRVDLVKTVIVATVICAALSALFYLRSNVVENIVDSLEEKGSMDNMIWFVKHFSALLPSIVMIALMSIAYGNPEKYVPVITQKEKMIAYFIVAVFFFGALIPYASSLVVPAVIEEEEVVEEATTVFRVLANWFFVQIVPFIIIETYHYARVEAEKKLVSESDDAVHADTRG